MNNIKKISIHFLLVFVAIFTPLISFAVTRSEIIETAISYKDHLWTASEGNVCHNKIVWRKDKQVKIDTPDKSCGNACFGLGWWNTEQNINHGVPYKWGGFSTLASFDDGIRSGSCGGDVYNNNELSGYGSYDSDAVGIDCSGFVSRSWDLKGQKTTKSLPGISKELKEYENLKEGDILNRVGHVRIFKEFDFVDPTKKLKVYEASARDWKVNEWSYRIKEDLQDEGYKPYTYLSIQDPDFSLADVEIVVDRSESMRGWTMWNKEGTKMDRAKEIARYFVDSLRLNSRVGLTTFNDFGYSNYPLTLIGNGGVRAGVKETIDAIPYPDDDTFIKKGLEIAREKLNTAGNSGSTDKTIILVTDGFETSTYFLAGVSLLEGDIISKLIEDGIKIYVVRIGGKSGFNLPPVLMSIVGPKNSNNKTEYSIPASEYYYPDLDHSFFYPNEVAGFLKGIAEETGGKYYTVNNSEDFQGVYSSIAADLYYEKETKLAKGKISQGGVFTEKILVDSSIEEITLSLTWPGSDLDLVLTRPDGTSAAGDDPDISFASAGTYKTYTVSQPMNGEWRLEIVGVDVSPGGESYTLEIGELGGMDFEAELDREEYSQGDLIKITAGVVDQTLDIPEIQYLRGIEVEAKIDGPRNKTYTPVIFSDDGSNGDEEAGDGIYTGVFSKNSFVGEYSFTVKARGGLNDEMESPFEKTETLTAFVKRAEKKKVVITVSDKEGSIFDEVTLEAEIKGENGELVAGDSNKVIFKVNSRIIEMP